MKKFLVTAALVLFSAVAAHAEDQVRYEAALTGKAEVSAVETSARGTAEFTPGTEEGQLDYRLSAEDLRDVEGAHIHLGKKGENGPPVASLMEGKKEGPVNGVIAEGIIMEMDLMGPMKGKSIADLRKLMESGGLYVNVHTAANPKGEIRGEIARVPVEKK